MKYYSIILLILLASVCRGQPRVLNKKITINLYAENVNPKDTIFFWLQNPADFSRPLKVIGKDMVNGYYHFEVPVDLPYGDFYLSKRATFTDKGGSSSLNFITGSTFWIAGDSVDICMKYKETALGVHSKITYVGRGALKYALSDKIDSIRNNTSAGDVDLSQNWALFGHPCQLAIDRSVQIVNENRSQLTMTEYQFLMAQAMYYRSSTVFYSIKMLYDKQRDAASKAIFLSNYKKNISKVTHRNLPDSILGNSDFIGFMFGKYKWESHMVNGRMDMSYIYHRIRQEETGLVRDRLIGLTFINCKKSLDFDDISAEASQFVQDRYTRSLITAMSLGSRGKAFKDFALLNTHDKPVRLSDHRGKIIFLDFWGNGCGACHVFYKDALSKVKKAFQKDSSVVFISISVDRKKERWIRGIESDMYTSKEAINLTTGSLGNTHPILKENRLNGAIPMAILLDRTGKIIKFNTQDLYTEKGLTAALDSAK